MTERDGSRSMTAIGPPMDDWVAAQADMWLDQLITYLIQIKEEGRFIWGDSRQRYMAIVLDAIVSPPRWLMDVTLVFEGPDLMEVEG